MSLLQSHQISSRTIRQTPDGEDSARPLHAGPMAGRAELARLSFARRYRAGATIIAERGQSSIVGTAVSGILKSLKTLPNGRQQIVGLVYPGDFFGRPFAEISEFSLEAATDAEICVVDRRAFEAVLARHPELEHELFVSTLHDLAFARERLVLLGCQNTMEKVATYLLLALVRRGGQPDAATGAGVAISPIGRRDLASYLGTTIETISRHLHLLSRMGVIRILDHAHFEVVDEARLIAASGLDAEDLLLFTPQRPLHAFPRPA